MDLLVFEKLGPPAVTLAALIARVRPLPRVRLDVGGEVLPLNKAFAALFALVRSLPRMNALVDD